MSVAAAIANRAYGAAALAARIRFERAATDPETAQQNILLRILRRNAETEVGRVFGFSTIRTAEEYRARVPLGDYESHRAGVERMAAGAPAIFTADTLRCFEPTGGSSGTSKLIPYTDALLGEISSATLPWVFDLLRHTPGVRNGSAYWAVSPPARQAAATTAGIAIGLEHDSDYFPRFVRTMLDRVIATPRALARMPDVATCRYVTLRALLARTDLSFVSVWSPSFLTLLAESLDRDFARLLTDLETGTLSVTLEPSLRAELVRTLPPRPARARELRFRFGRIAPDDLGLVWERLALISCWADGHASRALEAMRQRFPLVAVQPKGLLATEGVTSFPLHAAGGAVAAVASHFIELLPNDSGDAIGVEEAQVGQTYEVALTTSGGLYRYRMRDLVRVDACYRHTPVLTFVGRSDAASDLRGEKLTPEFVETVIALALTDAAVRTPFAMLAPVWNGNDTPYYVLFAECSERDAERLAHAMEARLAQAHHYALCRALGQLAPVRGVAVEQGEATYERVCLARGQRAGSIKPAALDARLGWDALFVQRIPETAVA